MSPTWYRPPSGNKHLLLLLWAPAVLYQLCLKAARRTPSRPLVRFRAHLYTNFTVYFAHTQVIQSQAHGFHHTIYTHTAKVTRSKCRSSSKVASSQLELSSENTFFRSAAPFNPCVKSHLSIFCTCQLAVASQLAFLALCPAHRHLTDPSRFVAIFVLSVSFLA